MHSKGAAGDAAALAPLRERLSCVDDWKKKYIAGAAVGAVPLRFAQEAEMEANVDNR